MTTAYIGFREIEFDQAKIDWLWEQLCKYKTLFSDYTRGKKENYLALINDPYTYWLEVGDDDAIVGVIYLTGLQTIVDAHIHALVFDYKGTDKVTIYHDAIVHIFQKFPSLHRLTASFPVIYHMTNRLVRKLGFKYEGTRKDAHLIGGKWVDEVIFGLLASEVKDG